MDFLFGPFARPEIGGHSFAIAALPTIIFLAALISILYRLGVMQLAIRWIGGGLEDEEERPANLIIPAAQGAQTGLKLAAAVGAGGFSGPKWC